MLSGSEWAEVVLLAVASNIDDLGAGFVLGLKGSIPSYVTFTVALLSGITMLIGLVLGDGLVSVIPPSTAQSLSSAIFLGFGLWFIVKGLRQRSLRGGDTASEGSPLSIAFTPVRALALGVLLGVDSLFLGVSGGLSGYPIFVAAALASLTSFSMMLGGSRLGNRLAIAFMRERAELVAGGILILLAVVG